MISLPNPYSKKNTMNHSQTLSMDFDDQEDYEHDDFMTAEDYDKREYYRNGWDESRYDRQRW